MRKKQKRLTRKEKDTNNKINKSVLEYDGKYYGIDANGQYRIPSVWTDTSIITVEDKLDALIEALGMKGKVNEILENKKIVNQLEK